MGKHNKDLTPINNKHQKHGLWEAYYFIDDSLMYKGYFKNGNYNGLWERYYNDGTLWYKEYYNNIGNIEGIGINR